MAICLREAGLGVCEEVTFVASKCVEGVMIVVYGKLGVAREEEKSEPAEQVLDGVCTVMDQLASKGLDNVQFMECILLGEGEECLTEVSGQVEYGCVGVGFGILL